MKKSPTSQLLGSKDIRQEVLETLRARGGDWAAYQNHDLGHYGLGHLCFVQVGPANTYKDAPAQYPDTALGLGWRHRRVGWVDLKASDCSHN